MNDKTIYPDSILIDATTGTIGVGEIYGIRGGVRMKLVTPNGRRHIEYDNAKTYNGPITKEFAQWLSSTYDATLEELEDGCFLVKQPPRLDINK